MFGISCHSNSILPPIDFVKIFYALFGDDPTPEWMLRKYVGRRISIQNQEYVPLFQLGRSNPPPHCQKTVVIQ